MMKLRFFLKDGSHGETLFRLHTSFTGGGGKILSGDLQYAINYRMCATYTKYKTVFRKYRLSENYISSVLSK